MMTDYQKIRDAIERSLNSEKSNFIIYPYGEYGVLAKRILNDSFGIVEDYVIDNRLSQYNSSIKNLDFFKELDSSKYTVLFTCANPDIYDEALQPLKQFFDADQIIDIFSSNFEERVTCRGKYSYGPLCDHWLVESVGAFCSFAEGTDVVENHAVGYISTHPFLYLGGIADTIREKRWDEWRGSEIYFEGVAPKGENYKLKRIHVGNDVWLGKNVLITNSADIGNGVIAGAGAVITKDVPDYAVVAGSPARIIRYRYTQEQIIALNRIAWWNWSDEKIGECYDDFFEEVEVFINKHKDD
jgi:acetyltransferase-like isoleucine patch superfamily enzyme